MKPLALTLTLMAGLALTALGQNAPTPAPSNRPAGAAVRQGGPANGGPTCQRDCPRRGNGQCNGAGPRRDGGGMHCGSQGRGGRR